MGGRHGVVSWLHGLSHGRARGAIVPRITRGGARYRLDRPGWAVVSGRALSVARGGSAPRTLVTVTSGVAGARVGASGARPFHPPSAPPPGLALHLTRARGVVGRASNGIKPDANRGWFGRAGWAINIASTTLLWVDAANRAEVSRGAIARALFGI